MVCGLSSCRPDVGRSSRRRRSAKKYSHLVEVLQDISTDLLQLLQAGHRVLRLLVNRLQLGSHLSKDCSLLKELSLSHSGIQLGEVDTELKLIGEADPDQGGNVTSSSKAIDSPA